MTHQVRDLGLRELEKLLRSSIHEYRSPALLILLTRYEPCVESAKRKIVDFYLRHTCYVPLTAKLLADRLSFV